MLLLAAGKPSPVLPCPQSFFFVLGYPIFDLSCIVESGEQQWVFSSTVSKHPGCREPPVEAHTSPLSIWGVAYWGQARSPQTGACVSVCFSNAGCVAIFTKQPGGAVLEMRVDATEKGDKNTGCLGASPSVSPFCW